jgi:hypothetical protein
LRSLPTSRRPRPRRSRGRGQGARSSACHPNGRDRGRAAAAGVGVLAAEGGHGEGLVGLPADRAGDGGAEQRAVGAGDAEPSSCPLRARSSASRSAMRAFTSPRRSASSPVRRTGLRGGFRPWQICDSHDPLHSRGLWSGPSWCFQRRGGPLFSAPAAQGSAWGSSGGSDQMLPLDMRWHKKISAGATPGAAAPPAATCWIAGPGIWEPRVACSNHAAPTSVSEFLLSKTAACR